MVVRELLLLVLEWVMVTQVVFEGRVLVLTL